MLAASVTSPESKRAYVRALRDYRAFLAGMPGGGAFSKATVTAFRESLEARGLAPSSINVQLAALRRLAVECADAGVLPLDVADGIKRARGARRLGRRLGNWLTLEETEKLLAVSVAPTYGALRDRAALALLVGCGLRRSEVVALRLADIRLIDARWVLVDLHGKGGRVRSVPMPAWCKLCVDRWVGARDGWNRDFPSAAVETAAVISGVSPHGSYPYGGSLTANALWEMVQKLGRKIGRPELSPHDLRRTFAHLAHKGQSALEQIQLSLGHQSIATTELYLGVRQNLQDAPCDRLGVTLRE